MTPLATLEGADALTENHVVEHVCVYLESIGYRIDQRLLTTQHGDDIIAHRRDHAIRLLIEAKGATSARPGSNRHGRAFDQSQASVHVCEAAFRALRTLGLATQDSAIRAGMALPDNTLHRRLMLPALDVLLQLGVVIFWVAGDGAVEVEANWRLEA